MNSQRIPSNQRADEILREIQRAGGTCRVSFLAETLDVTLETIRRNIRILEEKGIVRKVHGGVHLVDDFQEAPFESRVASHADDKAKLARAVVESIKDGDSVFLDIGSTTAFVALELRKRSNLLVVTNSVFVASTLATCNGNKVYFGGGELRAHDGGSFGAEAFDLVSRMNVQFAVFSVGAVNAEQGFMLHDLEEANLARVAAANAQVRIVVADHEKLDKRAPVSLSKDIKFDLFYTDSKPSSDITRMLNEVETDCVVVS